MYRYISIEPNIKRLFNDGDLATHVYVGNREYFPTEISRVVCLTRVRKNTETYD